MRFKIDRDNAPADVADGAFLITTDGHPLMERRRDGSMVYMRFDGKEAALKGQERAVFEGYDAIVYREEQYE